MPQQFIRACTLTGSGGQSSKTVNGGGQTDLRIRANIVTHTLQAPDQACFVITNPNIETVQAFQQEFASVTFAAGYEDGGIGQIFTGSVTYSVYGEIESRTDRLLRIYCASSDQAYNNSQVSQTLAAGSTPQDIVNTCLQSLGQYGVTMGKVTGVDLSQPSFPRGVPLAGMARDFLREVALSLNATYCITNNQLNIIGKDAMTSGTARQVNSNSGMIGQAMLTPQGVIVRMLVDSAVQVNTNVQLNPDTVVSPVLSGTIPAMTNAADLTLNLSNQLNASGLYRVLHIEYDLDTRGEPWFQTLTCLGVGQSLNPIQTGLGYS